MAAPIRSSGERLRSLLDRLTPGDEIHVSAASKETGLDKTTCLSVLEALLGLICLLVRRTACSFVGGCSMRSRGSMPSRSASAALCAWLVAFPQL